MPNITVPKTIIGNNLVAIPKKLYEEFLTWQKKIKETKTFTPTAAEKKALARARKNYAKGNYITLEELRRELGFTHRQRR